MKKIVLISAVVLSNVLAVTAFAQTTRADVKAEAASAVKSGSMTKGDVTVAPKAKSTAARADVKNEAAAAEKAGTIAVGDGAASKDTKAKSVKSRAEVKAETKAAVKSGDIPAGQQGTK